MSRRIPPPKYKRVLEYLSRCGIRAGGYLARLFARMQDIEIGGVAEGRITFELHRHLAPRTVENFR